MHSDPSAPRGWPWRWPRSPPATGHALAIVERERLARAAARAGARAANLAVDLITGPVEGEPIGIPAARHQITKEDAAPLLHQLSRTSHRDRHDIAAEMVRTADLGRLLDSRADGPARRGHLRIAASHGHTVTQHCSRSGRAARRPATSPAIHRHALSAS